MINGLIILFCGYMMQDLGILQPPPGLGTKTPTNRPQGLNLGDVLMK